MKRALENVRMIFKMGVLVWRGELQDEGSGDEGLGGEGEG